MYLDHDNEIGGSLVRNVAMHWWVGDSLVPKLTILYSSHQASLLGLSVVPPLFGLPWRRVST